MSEDVEIPIPDELLKEIDKACEFAGYTNRDEFVRDAIRRFLEEKSQSIKCEQVTLEIPVMIMDYLRAFYQDPLAWLEIEAVGWVKADIDALSPDKIADFFKMKPVFKKYLNDP